MGVKNSVVIEQDIAEILRARRFERKVSLKQIGEQMDLTDPAICKWERGAATPRTLAMFLRWAGLLGLNMQIAITDGDRVLYTASTKESCFLRKLPPCDRSTMVRPGDAIRHSG